MENCCISTNNAFAPAHYGLDFMGDSLNGLTIPNPQQCLWSLPSDDTFSIDLQDTIPSTFTFSPPSSESSNDFSSFNNSKSNFRYEKQSEMKQDNQDMSSVLLSVKLAMDHPTSQLSPCYTPPQYYQCHNATPFNNNPPLSCTIYPQLNSVNLENGCNNEEYCDYMTMYHQETPPNLQCPNNNLSWSTNSEQPHPILPGMSLNVNMDMAIPECPSTSPVDDMHQLQCPQVQWDGLLQESLSPQYANTPRLSSLTNPMTTSSVPSYSYASDGRPESTFDSAFTCDPQSPIYKPYNYEQSGNVCFADKDNELKQDLSEGENDMDKPNLCRICGKTYARPSTLKTHLRTHSGEKPYRCDDCNKSFSQAANLTAHVRTHSGEKPFRCLVCDRRFSQSSSVTTHMRTHSGERPYICKLCKKAFSDSSTLTKHLRIHSGEKPYQCKLCLLRFSQSGNLNRHMRVHSLSAGGNILMV